MNDTMKLDTASEKVDEQFHRSRNQTCETVAQRERFQ